MADELVRVWGFIPWRIPRFSRWANVQLSPPFKPSVNLYSPLPLSSFFLPSRRVSKLSGRGAIFFCHFEIERENVNECVHPRHPRSIQLQSPIGLGRCRSRYSYIYGSEYFSNIFPFFLNPQLFKFYWNRWMPVTTLWSRGILEFFFFFHRECLEKVSNIFFPKFPRNL